MQPTGSGWDVPEDLESAGEFRWWKIAAMRTLNLVIISHTPIWYRGHFYKGRMVPCLGDNCAMCAESVGSQLRYVFAGADTVTQRVGLLETGQSVASEIHDLALRHGQLRGLVIEIGKYSRSKNSRMELRPLDPMDGTWWAKLPIPDIAKALELTWQRANAILPEKKKDRVITKPSDYLAEAYK